jgi:antibiotic biosynthesis monooxygenase (ABM) superfamily enzyme
MRRRTHRPQVYQFVWSVACGVVVLLGLLAGLFLVSPAGVFGLVFISALLGSTVASSRWSKSRGAPRAARAWNAALTVGAVIAAIVAFAGYVVLLGLAGPSLLAIVAVTSPPVMRWIGRRSGHLAQSRALTTAELCRRWQESYEALRDATTAAARLRIVEARQHYLDELERRDPHGLSAWLERNASAAGDPSRFLAGEDGGDSR